MADIRPTLIHKTILLRLLLLLLLLLLLPPPPPPPPPPLPPPLATTTEGLAMHDGHQYLQRALPIDLGYDLGAGCFNEQKTLH